MRRKVEKKRERKEKRIKSEEMKKKRGKTECGGKGEGCLRKS